MRRGAENAHAPQPRLYTKHLVSAELQGIMGLPGADAWELAGFPGRLKVAAYLTADQVAAQYRVLVDVLLDAQEHSLTGVGRDELLAAVRNRITDATDA